MDFYSTLLAKKLNKASGGDVEVESLVVSENGRYSETGKAYNPVVVNVPQPVLTTKTITSNDTYNAADDNADGYSAVTVNVQPSLETLNATENGTYTPQGDGYDEVNVNVPLPENGYLLETETGNPITVTDAGAFPLASCDVDLEPIQDLHGYDNPWVGGAGKNKLSLVLSNLKSLNTDGTWSENIYTLNGTTFEVLTDSAGNVDGIKVDGTANDQTLFNCGEYVPTAETSIKLNGVPETGSRSTYSINFYLTGSGFGDDIYSGDSDVITIPANENLRYLIVIRGGYNAQSLMFYPMARLATETDPTFEPYSNICPISGRTEEVITQKDNPTNPTVTKTYTIQFGQTVYGCHVDATKGGLVVDTAYAEFDGSSDEDWSYHDHSQTTANFLINVNDARSNAPFIRTNMYPKIPIGEVGIKDGFINFSDTYFRVYFSKNYGITTVADWKTYLASHQLQVCYELATPITIPITPTLIELLQGTNTISADDDLTIKYFGKGVNA